MPTARSHSVGLRIWHWLNSVTVFALLATYFLRTQLGNHGRYIARRLSESGIAVTEEVSKGITKELVSDLWGWHIKLGYVLAALFAWRMIVWLRDRRDPLRETGALVRQAKTTPGWAAKHDLLVRLSYIVFYFAEAFMITTGFLMVFGKSLGIEKPLRHLVHESHEYVMWFFVAFIVVHVLGIFVAENRDGSGIVSGMIGPGPDAVTRPPRRD